MNKPDELIDKCRFCLENTGSVAIVSDDCILSDMLFTCTSIKITLEANGPRMMCVVCIQRLYDAFSFREQCLRNEGILQTYAMQKDCESSVQSIKLEDTNDEQDWYNFDDKDLCGDGALLKFNKKNEDVGKSYKKKRHKSEKDAKIAKDKTIDIKSLEDNTTYNENGALCDSKEFSEISCDIKGISAGTYLDSGIIQLNPDKNLNIKTQIIKSPKKKEKSKFICDLCGHTVHKKWDLISHTRKHTGEKPYQCKTCDKKFAYLGGLRSHERQHTDVKSFVCEECGAGLSTKETLQAHMRLHSGEMPFSCDICGKKFRAATNLRTHTKIHTQDKRHTCPVCSKMFYTRSDMQSHARRHTGDRPYSCPLCPRRFTGRNNQRLHMKIHTGQRDFHCLHCTKAFVSKDALVRHCKVHSTERAYECDKCGRKFAHKSSLMTHEVTHSNTREHVCDICNQRFGYASGLHAHRRRKHNIQSTRTVLFIGNNLSANIADKN